MAIPGGLSRSEVAVLEAIRQRGQTTRGDVAAAIGLGIAMTARVVTRLQAAGLIREAGRLSAHGPGRQALRLELNPQAASVLGLDIGTELVHLLVADLQGNVQAYRELPSSVLAGLSQDEIVVKLADLACRILEEQQLPIDQVAVAGVAITGVIDSDHGMCLVRSNTPGWERFPLAERLGQTLGVPVLLEETARAKSVAELRIGVAIGASHFLYIDAGTSIGASIVIDGRPLRGISGLAGEIGHVTVDPDGPLCRCGNRGCVQASASARAIVSKGRELLRQGVFSILDGRAETLTLADIAVAANEGDKLALGLLTGAGERIGEALSMALNLLGLDMVVMGGALAQCSSVVLEAASRIVQLRVLPIVPLGRSLQCSTLGRDAAARGIALQAIDWLFEAPAERLLYQGDRSRRGPVLEVAATRH